MAILSPKEGMTMIDAETKARAKLVADLLKADDKYTDTVRVFGDRGVLEDNDVLTDAQKADKKSLREEIYQQKARKAGGDQLKAAKVKDWKALTGHERDELQQHRNVTLNAVDAVWKRMRIAWKGIQKEDKEKESGAPITATAKLLMDRFKEFDISATKGNKKSGEVPIDKLAVIMDATREALATLVKESKADTAPTEGESEGESEE